MGLLSVAESILIVIVAAAAERFSLSLSISGIRNSDLYRRSRGSFSPFSFRQKAIRGGIELNNP